MLTSVTKISTAKFTEIHPSFVARNLMCSIEGINVSLSEWVFCLFIKKKKKKIIRMSSFSPSFEAHFEEKQWSQSNKEKLQLHQTV